uniref:NADH-ubiquinone oxidoreductase chain 4L n=1 Tax=Phaenacantha marcida TaxID=498930 RepID=B7SMK1_9HEMI|nr:NADH dehydrogenase subunit 4L [Phaenacantha marcida]ABZ02095.1 NADH dehydrogenase subunit 4L [Phaenacantha marcida]
MTFGLIIMFFIGFISFCLIKDHLLTTLITLEYLVLVNFLTFFLYLSMFGCELYFILVYLIFCVCEGALGLGVLVNMIRSHGNDMLSSLSSLLW